MQAEDFVSQVRWVFLGRVIHQESFRRGGDIFTRHVFRVEEALLGKPGEVVELIEYGGTVGDLTQIVTHQAAYQPGREYVVFAYRDLLGQYRTFAGPLGQLPAMKSKDGARVVRVYGSHPLASLLGRGRVLWGVGSLGRELREVRQRLQDGKKTTP